MEPRRYTPEELEQLHRMQVQALVPLALRIWREMQEEERARADADEIGRTRRDEERRRESA